MRDTNLETYDGEQEATCINMRLFSLIGWLMILPIVAAIAGFVVVRNYLQTAGVAEYNHHVSNQNEVISPGTAKSGLSV